jgi:hypothetical protein
MLNRILSFSSLLVTSASAARQCSLTHRDLWQY